ncbi:hypothetical protein [Rhizobium leguminosarum]
MKRSTFCAEQHRVTKPRYGCRDPEKTRYGIPDGYAQLLGTSTPEIEHFCIIRALLRERYPPARPSAGQNGLDDDEMPPQATLSEKMQFWYAKDIYFDIVRNGKIH